MQAIRQPRYFFKDNHGKPLIGGKLVCHGVVYADVYKTIPHTNPIYLDEKGSALLYFDNVPIDVYDKDGHLIQNTPANQQACFFDKFGNALSYGKVFVYLFKSTIFGKSYANQDGTISNSNPVILDKDGKANIYIDKDCRLRVYHQNDVLVYDEDILLGDEPPPAVIVTPEDDNYIPEEPTPPTDSTPPPIDTLPSTDTWLVKSAVFFGFVVGKKYTDINKNNYQVSYELGNYFANNTPLPILDIGFDNTKGMSIDFTNLSPKNIIFFPFYNIGQYNTQMSSFLNYDFVKSINSILDYFDNVLKTATNLLAISNLDGAKNEIAGVYQSVKNIKSLGMGYKLSSGDSVLKSHLINYQDTDLQVNHAHTGLKAYKRDYFLNKITNDGSNIIDKTINDFYNELVISDIGYAGRYSYLFKNIVNETTKSLKYRGTIKSNEQLDSISVSTKINSFCILSIYQYTQCVVVSQLAYGNRDNPEYMQVEQIKVFERLICDIPIGVHMATQAYQDTPNIDVFNLTGVGL